MFEISLFKPPNWESSYCILTSTEDKNHKLLNIGTSACKLVHSQPVNVPSCIVRTWSSLGTLAFADFSSMHSEPLGFYKRHEHISQVNDKAQVR